VDFTCAARRRSLPDGPHLPRVPTDERLPMLGIEAKLDKAYHGKSAQELADAPVDALYGVSPGDADLLKQAFNIKTVRDLGTNKFFLAAQAISQLAG
jgi:hypothetical protein